MLAVNYEKKYVGTYKEIALMFISFSIVLFFLYPKDMLNKQILSEKSNYDLSILYLKNMLKNDSSNEELMLALAQQSLNSGNKDLSFQLLSLLNNSQNEQRRATSYLLSYKLAKDDYFYLKEHKKSEALEQKYKELQTIYETIIKDALYKEEDVEVLYKEASFLKDIPSSYILVQKLLLKKPQDLQLLSDAYYIARKMDDPKKAVYYIDKLIAVGVDNVKEWYGVKFNILLEQYSLSDALSVLQKEARASEYWQLKLANFYLYHKQYQNAADVYMDIFESKESYNEKKELFKTALKTLQGGNKAKDAVELAYKHENYFFKDGEMRILFLKVYIASGDLKKASKLSKRMLKGRNY